MNIRLVITTALILILLSSCSSAIVSPPTVVPTDTPLPEPTFQGRLLIGYENGILVLRRDPDTHKFKERWIAAPGEGYEIPISPDQRYLVFSNSDGTQLFDLSTYETTTLFPTSGYYFHWSPDSTRFSFHDGQGLNVYNITTQTSELIAEAPSALYMGSTRYGRLGPGYWVGKDRLLFQRFTGPMPESITFPRAPELDENTTTLAILGDPITLIDLPQRLFFLAVSNDGSYSLLVERGRVYLAGPFDDSGYVKQHSLGPLEVRDDCGRFIPDSQDFMVEGDHTIYFVDSETLEVSQSFEIPSSGGSVFTFMNEVAWVGDPHEGIVVRVGQWDRLWIADLKTGVKVELWDASKYGHPSRLLWLP